MSKPMIRILFQDDSITDCGRERNNFHGLGNGYVQKIAEQAKGYEILNRGVDGNIVADLKARQEDDCIKLKPDKLSVLIDVNDVWRFIDGRAEINDVKFDKDYRSVLECVKEKLPKIKIIVLEPFVLKVGKGNAVFRELLDKKMTSYAI